MADDNNISRKIASPEGSSSIAGKYLPDILKYLGIVSPLVAMRLPKVRPLLTGKYAPQASSTLYRAIEAAGGKLTNEGLSLDLLRNQKPIQAGAPVRGGGVFYSVKNDPRRDIFTQPHHYWGGPQKIEGSSLFRNPLFAFDTAGGPAVSEHAAQKLFGLDYEKYRSDALRFERPSKSWSPQDIKSFLNDYAPEVSKESFPMGTYEDRRRIYPWLSEAAVANKARQEGFDSIVQYNDPSDPRIGEVFDLRESHYPAPEGGYKLWPQYQSILDQLKGQ